MERDNSTDEIKIAKNIIKYINKPDFMEKEITSLDRIFALYFDQQIRDPKEEKEVINFLFKYYEAKGDNACVLFRHIKKSSELINIVNRLYYQYNRKFDFDFINPSLFLSSFDIIKTNQKLKRFLYYLLAFIFLLMIISIRFYFQTDKVKNELNKQLNDQIQAKEKLQIELRTIQQSCENDKKINEKLDSELKTKFSNLKEEMVSIKENFQKELTNVKKKQHETEELTNCKESLQNEHSNRITLEVELTKCNTTLEVERESKRKLENQLEICNKDKHELADELLQMKNSAKNKRSLFEDFKFLIGKINKKFALYLVADLAMLLFSIFFYNESSDFHIPLSISFISEIALDFSLFFEFSKWSYIFFSLVFIISIIILAIISYNKDIKSEKLVMIPLVYIVFMSTIKYMQFIPKDDFNNTYNLVCLAFVIEIPLLCYCHYHCSHDTIISLILIGEVTVFCYCSQIELSPSFISNTVFIISLIAFILGAVDSSNDRLVLIHSLFVTLMQYLLYLLKKHDKILYMIVTLFFVAEIICSIIFTKYKYIFMIELCNTAILFNFSLFTTIVALAIVGFVCIEAWNRNGPTIFLYMNAFLSILIYLFPLYKFLKAYH